MFVPLQKVRKKCNFSFILCIMEYSVYQKAIFDAICKGSGNIVVNAVAGSGKTFTIVSACRMLGLSKYDVKFLAFNKAIADELQRKIGDCADVTTLHSFGYSVLRSIRKGLKLDNNRWRKYVSENIMTLSRSIGEDTPSAKVYGFISNVLHLFNLCRVNLVAGGDLESVRKICDAHNCMTLFDEERVVSELLYDAYVLGDCIDFTDMVVLPLQYKERIPSYKFVFIDECQDLNTAQRELMLCAAKGGRFVAVGDRRQAINGFAGADCQSFQKIVDIPDTKELPLSVNYRCGKEFIKLAQDIVPQIEAHDGAIDGNVVKVDKLDMYLFKYNTMVLCRSNAPLVGLCLKLIKKGVTAIVKGRDIGEQLTAFAKGSKARTMEELESYCENELKKCVAKIKKERKCTDEDAKDSARYISLNDKLQCLLVIAEEVGISSMASKIETMFSDYAVRNGIVLSTIHKAKGLESDRVMILCPHKLPLTWKHQLDWQLEQEMNLKYVALTRAKKEMIFVNMTEEEITKAVL